MKRGTRHHPKLVALATLLALEPWAAVGLLETLWDWTRRYAIRGDLGKWSDADIAQGVGWGILTHRSATELVDALRVTRWLDDAPPPHRLVIHDVAQHADNTWRQCLQDAGLDFWDGSPPRRRHPVKTGDELQKLPRNSPQPLGTKTDPGSRAEEQNAPPFARSGKRRPPSLTGPPTRRTTLPDDFALTEERQAVARRHKVHEVGDVGDQFVGFCAHHRAKGSLMANWDQAWVTWCLNAVRFARGTRQGPAVAAPYTPTLDINRYAVEQAEKRRRERQGVKP